jgi:hypothetical protein
LEEATKGQAPRAKPAKGTTVGEEEDHPTPEKRFVISLVEIGDGDPLLAWVNRGLCADERAASSAIDGLKRGRLSERRFAKSGGGRD